MLAGYFVLKGSAATRYSPTFSRQGGAALFSFEIVEVFGSPTLTITVEHRNLEDTSWTTAATFSSITAAGVVSADASGLKELLRYTYAITGITYGIGVYIIDAPPAWRPY